MMFPGIDDEILEGLIKKGREFEGAINKITEDARLEKSALNEEYKQAARECEGMLAVEQKYKELRKDLYEEKKCNQEQRPLYVKRNEIVKAIPKFWLVAFYSHPALGKLIGLEDQKIFRCIDSVDVIDHEDVTPGYTIMFNFNENPYFTDTSLKKRISFSENGTTDLSAVKINWKIDMNIATEYHRETPLSNASFFTWFCAPQVLRRGYRDEVSELIKDELWPNAVAYFNGDASDEKSDEEE